MTSFLILHLSLQLLASPQVASRVYHGQMEQLLGLYQTQTMNTDGRMNLETFSNVANSLLLMIYQNAYPDMVGHMYMYCFQGIDCVLPCLTNYFVLCDSISAS